MSAIKHLPLVSIGFPVYNGERYIRAALRALVSQTYPYFEIIISDNASTDKTAEISLELAERDKRVIYFRQEENIGAVNNFNFVLSKSRGEYFMWAASDDLWDSNFILRIINEFQNCDDETSLIASTWYTKASSFNLPQRQPESSIDSILVNPDYFLSHSVSLAPMIYGIYKREKLMEIQGMDETPTFGSDLITLFRLITVSKVRLLQSNQFYYRNDNYEIKGNNVLINQYLIHLKAVKNILRNLKWAKLLYILRKVVTYHRAIEHILNEHYSNSLYMKLQGGISALRLLWILLSIETDTLQSSEKSIFKGL